MEVNLIFGEREREREKKNHSEGKIIKERDIKGCDIK